MGQFGFDIALEHLAERILTTVQTLRLQKRHVLAYLRKALIAHCAGQPAPAIVPAGV